MRGAGPSSPKSPKGKANSSGRKKNTVATPTRYRWLQYMVYLWAFRLGLSGFGLIFPGMSLLALLFQSKSTELRELTLKTYDYHSFPENFKHIQSSGAPAIFTNASISARSNIDFVLEMSLSKLVKIMKKGASKSFSHFDYEKLWTSSYHLKANHELVPFRFAEFDHGKDEISLDSSCVQPDDDISMICRKHRNIPQFQVSHSLNHIKDMPFLSTLTPVIGSIVAENSKYSSYSPTIMLWMSNDANITTSPHFDMEDNFVLQLRGTKKFTISAPELYSSFEPYPSLHPQWRQAKNQELITKVFVQQRVQGGTQTSSSVANSINAKSAQPHTEKTGNKPSETTEAPVWEVELHSGDLLYIPAFFFHSATSTSTDSVSINTWIRSRAFETMKKLQRTDLPFTGQQSTDVSRKSSSVNVYKKFKIIFHCFG